MTPIKRTLTYIFRGTLLRLRITWGKNQLTLSIGYHVDRTDEHGRIKWDGRRCKANTTHGAKRVPASVINKVVTNIEHDIEMAFYEFEMADITPTPEMLKTRLKGDSEMENLTIKSLFDRFIIESERSRQWSFNTVKSVRQVATLIEKFRPRLKISQLNRELIDEFIAWQSRNRILPKSKKSRKSVGYSNPVILKHTRILKWFIRWAVRNNLLPNDILFDFHPNFKTIDKPIIFLEWEELMRLEQYEYPVGSEMDIARDVFCFCCFTSLRYSDMENLKKSDVKSKHIEVVTIKTGSRLKIELNKHSRRILEKYKNIAGKYALPRITNQRLNILLKKIGEDINLDEIISVSQYYGATRKERSLKKFELLTSHAGRRTFICNALAMGIAPNIVMKWTGHSEYSAMKPYIDVANSIKAKAMEKFDI